MVYDTQRQGTLVTERDHGAIARDELVRVVTDAADELVRFSDLRASTRFTLRSRGPDGLVVRLERRSNSDGGHRVCEAEPASRAIPHGTVLEGCVCAAIASPSGLEGVLVRVFDAPAEVVVPVSTGPDAFAVASAYDLPRASELGALVGRVVHVVVFGSSERGLPRAGLVAVE